jgi:drug/metabolite transporter (DMT)-like permease
MLSYGSFTTANVVGGILPGIAAALTAACELPALTLLAFVGCLLMWRAPRETLIAFAPTVAIVAAAFFAVNWLVYIGLRPQEDRNYGGMTSGMRWMFWCAPLWLLAMIPAADRLSRSIAGMALAAVLLTMSVLSASYPTWNPWVHPWIYNWLQWAGWL